MRETTRLVQMEHLCQQVSAMASTLEDAPTMPGGGTLQGIADTAWNALITLHLGIEDWIACQEDTPHA